MLHKIRLELARCKEVPESAQDIGYDFSAPWTEAGHINADAFHQHKDRYRML